MSVPAPLDWRLIGKNSTMVRAEDPLGGSWTVYPDRRYNPPEIKYQAPLPEGETFHSWFDKTKGSGFNEPQDFINHASIAPQEMGYAFNQDFGKQLIERFRAGAEGLSDARAILVEAGFVQADYSADIYHLRLSKGTITVNVRDGEEVWIDCDYSASGSPRWHNMLRLEVAHRNHDGSKIIPIVWPVGCDPLKVGAKFIVDVVVPFVKNTRFKRTWA